MHTSKFLTPVLFALATAAAGSAFAGGYNTYPEIPSTGSTVTRAQVNAERVQAAKNGTLEVSDATYPLVQAAGRHMSRAEVQHDLTASAPSTGTVTMQR